MSGHLNAALNAGKRGWHIYPIVPGTKRSLIPDPLNAATTDEKQIREWWTKWPNANIGVNCGKSGLVVLDVDTKKGKQGAKSLLALLEGDCMSPLLDTLNAHSWSGGRHYFYKGECGSSNSKLAPDLDIKGVNGAVVIAPSFVEEEGLVGQYRWADPGEGEKWPIRDFPDLFRPKETKKTPIREVAQFPEGGRHDGIVSLAGWYCRLGLAPSAREAALQADNLERCKPPLDLKEVTEISKSAKWAADPKSLPPPVPSASPEPALVIVNGGEVMTDEAFLKKVQLEVSWRIEGFLQCGGLMLLAALPKVGKSELARNMAKAVATGSDFLGRRTKKGKVLWIGLAEPEGTLRKAQETMGLLGIGILWVTSRPEPPWSHWLARKIEEHRPDFVIVDEIGRLATDLVDAYNYSQVLAATQPFIDLRTKYGTTFVLNHHDKKSGGTMGSAMWDGAVDCIMSLSRSGQTRTIQTTQRLGEDLEPTILARDKNTGLISCTIPKALADQRKVEQLILDALTPGREITRQALADLSPQGAWLGRSAVDALLAAGLIEAIGTGQKGDPRVYRSFSCDPNASLGRPLGRPEAFVPHETQILQDGKKGTPADFGSGYPNVPEGTRGNPTQPEAPDDTRATRGIAYHDDFRHRSYAEVSANGSTHGHADVEVRVEAPFFDEPL